MLDKLKALLWHIPYGMGCDAGYKEGYEAGVKRGALDHQSRCEHWAAVALQRGDNLYWYEQIEQARQAGKAEGMKEGQAAGYYDGIQHGYRDGYNDGRNRINEEVAESH